MASVSSEVDTQDQPRLDTLELLEVEADAQHICGATNDHRESVAAFVAKRPMTFTGR